MMDGQKFFSAKNRIKAPVLRVPMWSQEFVQLSLPQKSFLLRFSPTSNGKKAEDNRRRFIERKGARPEEVAAICNIGEDMANLHNAEEVALALEYHDNEHL